jgi:GAF domain-containing protein
MAVVTDPSAEPFLPLASIVFSEQTYENTLQHVVDIARDCVLGCSMAGMTLLDRTGPATAVATSRAAARVDAIQYRVNGGPCLDAYRRQVIVRIESTEDDDRWPEFCQGAVNEGVLSTLSFPLIVQGDGLGALNLYSDRRNGFDDIDERTGTVFALHASTTLANVRAFWQNDALRHNLEQALETRGVIDQAKGILMSQQNISADEAFEVLKRASQRANRKVHDLAQEIVDARGTRIQRLES